MPTVNKKQKRYPWQPAQKPFEQMKDRAWSQALYNSWRWRKLAKAEIMQEPYCAECYKKGIVNTENLQRDHVDGFTNEDEFWNGRRQTLCRWHNMNKAQRKGAETINKLTGKGQKGGAAGSSTG